MNKAMEAMRKSGRVAADTTVYHPALDKRLNCSRKYFDYSLRACRGSNTDFTKLLRVRKFAAEEKIEELNGITVSPLKGNRVHYTWSQL